MANKPAKAEGAEGEAPKKSKKMLIIIIVAVLVLAIAGGAAVMLLGKKKPADGEEADADAEAAHEAPAKAKVSVDKSKPPVFVPLEPFTVNLQPETGEQFLQVVLNFRAADAKLGDEVKVYMPEIRHHILMLLSSKKASEISSMEGREQLANEICIESNKVLGYEPEAPKKRKKAAAPAAEEPEALECHGPIISVLFTSFIVQ